MITIPMPQLKVRSISVAPAAQPLASQSKTGSGVHAEASIAASTALGSTRGRFSRRPPPVMCASAFTLCVRIAARHGVM